MFPVQVRSDGPVTLWAEGCLPCDVAGGAATVPMLAVSTPGDLHGGDAAVPLRLPGDGERLVGTTADVPADLFPAGRVIPVRLDPADPLPGPAAAWEVLDAIVLDRAAMAGVSDGRRSTLLAGGVTLAVAGDGPPDGRWPWRRRGRAWVLAYERAGPAGIVEADAYGPTQAWTPGWSTTVRGAAAAMAGLVGVVTVTLSVGGRRAWVRVAGPVLACAAAAGGVVVWRARLDPVAHAGGDVTVAGGPWRQRDAWVYDRARAAADVTVPWAGWTHPVFADASAVAADRPRLSVAADGTLAFTMHLAAGAAVAFVRRDVTADGAPAVTAGRGAAMRDAAPLYLSLGDRVAGETAPPPGRWPGVLVVRR